MIELNLGNFDRVIEILKPLVCTEINESQDCVTYADEMYFRHVRLASALAGKGNYDINEILDRMVVENKSLEEALAGDSNLDLSDSDQRTDFAADMAYLQKAIEVLADVFLVNPRPDSSDLNAEKFLVSGQFQELVYSAIKILNCETIFNFISADLASQRGVLDEFPMCSFTSITGKIDDVINIFPELFGDCESCSAAAEQFSEQQEALNGILGELGEGSSDEERTSELLVEKCIEQGSSEEACRGS
ncbi:MAG: hypothetical protein OXT67_02385 [Zetaproteobacteria bacterium]|nr:hypothetical protein [Zetaproteobacteria bacterium]